MITDPTQIEEVFNKDLPLSDEDCDAVIALLRQERQVFLAKPPRRKAPSKAESLLPPGKTLEDIVQL